MPRLGASACVWREGQVLLIQRTKPPLSDAWSLPGGHVEAGETTLEAASRELAEETGVSADLQQLAGLYDIIRRDPSGIVTMHYVIACYAGFWRSGEAKAQSDAAAARWVLPADFGGMPFAPNVRAAISRSRELLRF
ncbi:NUDIX hydrolase [Aestuariivirga sp.]|uniref:NUDIX hydrolase n=1 Tax=Aestuariivirga sp. TaxID=2650926 RepID=UPI0039E225C9